MFRHILKAAVGAGLIALAVPASAEEKTFEKPMQGKERLDWCLNWADQCGGPAANAWCVAQGYKRAANYNEAHDIPPTRLITGGLCVEQFCDSFSFITCSR
jgi:hypothetical protein